MKSIEQTNINHSDSDLLRRCKAAITKVVGNADVILYGSHARGEAQAYSDYDLLILVDEPVNILLKEKILDQVYPVQLETERMISFIVYNKQQWQSPLYRVMPLHKNIDREGIVL